MSPKSAATASDGAAVVAEPIQAPRDHLAHAVRHALRIPARPEILLGRQEVDDLADEERIAVRLAVERFSERRGVAARPRQGDPARAVRSGQPAEQEPARRRLAGEARQRGEERMLALHLGVAIRGDDEQTHVGQVGRDELEQLERGAVRPVDVVQHDDEPRRPGDGCEKAAHDVEEAKARAVRFPALARRELGHAIAHIIIFVRRNILQFSADSIRLDAFSFSNRPPWRKAI